MNFFDKVDELLSEIRQNINFIDSYFQDMIDDRLAYDVTTLDLVIDDLTNKIKQLEFLISV